MYLLTQVVLIALVLLLLYVVHGKGATDLSPNYLTATAACVLSTKQTSSCPSFVF